VSSNAALDAVGLLVAVTAVVTKLK